MAQPKIYAGIKLRETRARLGLTQKTFAEQLGVSLPYLNQMENNNRPVAGGVVRILADRFDLNVADLAFDGAERIVLDLREALADPLFADAPPPMIDMRLTASSAPAMAQAFLDLHRAYRLATQRLASADMAHLSATPHDEVGDFFRARDNYVDALEEPHSTDPTAKIDELLDGARFRSDAARTLGQSALLEYYAAATIMPYATFLRAARETRYDIERLAGMFGASIEQTALRLSTLQRPGDRGGAFVFIRVDQTDGITHRMGFDHPVPMRCIYQAFETPTRFIRDLVETADGKRYLCVAKDVSQSGGRFGVPVKRIAIVAGCEITHARDTVYAEGLDLNNRDAYQRLR